MAINPVITISRSLGSGGTDVGFRVARELGWHFCDRRILRMAADATGLSAADMAFHEDRPSSYLDWLKTILALGSPEAHCAPLPELPMYGRELFEVQREVILRMVEHAPSVIVGRGAFVALKGRPATLHVSIHADLEFRIASLLRRGKAPDRRAAQEAITASDLNRGSFIREISGLDWRDPKVFDLTLNTSELGLEGCAERILQASRALREP